MIPTKIFNELMDKAVKANILTDTNGKISFSEPFRQVVLETIYDYSIKGEITPSSVYSPGTDIMYALVKYLGEVHEKDLEGHLQIINGMLNAKSLKENR